jgi:hypothetical protein
MAQEDRVNIDPIVRSDRERNLTRMIYEETGIDRQFVISLAERESDEVPEKFISYFTKKTGLEFELTLLYITISSFSKFSNLTWKAYKKWMHENIAEDEIENYISKLL